MYGGLGSLERRELALHALDVFDIFGIRLGMPACNTKPLSVQMTDKGDGASVHIMGTNADSNNWAEGVWQDWGSSFFSG